MRKWLNNYYDFSKSEFNGLLVLTSLIALLALVPKAYSFFHEDDKYLEDDLIIKSLRFKEDKLENSTAVIDNHEKLDSKPFKERYQRLFKFDPNTITADEWVSLGLTPRQAAGIIKYVDKGGRFRKPEDLKKMYTITAALYNKLIPYVDIQLVERKEMTRVTQSPESRPTLRVVEINAADSADLDGIRGIGPTFAMRILKYRDRIGGFYKREQLLEIFGLDSAKYLEIKEQITVNPSDIRKININSAELPDFKNHPYIRYKQINAIIQYRKQHGAFKNATDLLKVIVLPADIISKLEPYLTF
ncbi:MAG: helix-hairpin-helix domain-containing protein [Bacteroidota bacterium]